MTRGRKVLVAAALAMFLAFFMGAFTRERARKPYLVWNTMGMNQQMVKLVAEVNVGHNAGGDRGTNGQGGGRRRKGIQSGELPGVPYVQRRGADRSDPEREQSEGDL